MNLSNVMEELAGRLAEIPDLRAHAWPAASVTAPAGIVAYPDEIVYDLAGGYDQITIPVVLLAGRATERTTRDVLSAWVSTGPNGVKARLEGGRWVSFDTARVTRATIDVYAVAATEYLAAIFEIDIAG